MTALKDRVKLDEPSPDLLCALHALLERATAKMLQLSQIVHQGLGSVKKGSKISSAMVRLRWIKDRSTIRELQKEISEIKLNIAALWGGANS
jgi:hypothetical protein